MADKQLHLLDVTKTIATACPVPGCGAIRLPGQDKVITCEHERVAFLERDHRRPNGCLNAFDPTADPFPEGY